MRWVRIVIVGAFALVAAFAALAGNLAGSGSGPGGESLEATATGAAGSASSAPPDLSASAEIRRSFMAPGQVAIAVTNNGDASVRVLGVELITESFAPLGVQEFDATVPPSVNPRDLITHYGEARCPDGAASAAEQASVVLTVETEDETRHSVTAELSYPNGTLDRLLQESCAAQAVAAAARIELGELTEAEDGTLEGRLSVTPLGEAALDVTEVRGSVLFEITAGEAQTEAGAVAVPLVFDAHRCEGHAVGDAKQPFGFTVWVTIDGGEPVATAIEVGEDRREALWTMLEHRCAQKD
jgi:hypothetical protein